MYNKNHTPEAIKKISDARKNHPYIGEENPNFGNGDKIKGEKNPMHGKKGKDHPAHGRKHTPEELKKMSKKLKKLIIIDNTYYDSRIEAGGILNINQDTITYRLNSPNFPNYKYVNKDKPK